MPLRQRTKASHREVAARSAEEMSGGMLNRTFREKVRRSLSQQAVNRYRYRWTGMWGAGEGAVCEALPLPPRRRSMCPNEVHTFVGLGRGAIAAAEITDKTAIKAIGIHLFRWKLAPMVISRSTTLLKGLVSLLALAPSRGCHSPPTTRARWTGIPVLDVQQKIATACYNFTPSRLATTCDP